MITTNQNNVRAAASQCEAVCRPLLLIILLSILEQIFFLLIGAGHIWCIDTPSYMAAWDNAISIGTPDTTRTPVYPVFLGLSRYLFGIYANYVVVSIQIIIFTLSILIFYKISLKIFGRHRFILWLIAFYALYPGINMYNLKMLTESFSISLVVFFIYAIINLYESPNLVNSLITLCLILLSIFLRPSMLYLLPAILIIAIVWFINKKRQQSLSLIVISLICCASMLGYMADIKRQTGYLALTTVSTFNDLFTALENRLLIPGTTGNRALASVINEANHDSTLRNDNDKVYSYIRKIVPVTTNSEIKQIVDESKIYNRKGWLKARGRYLYQSAFTTIFSFQDLPVVSFICFYIFLTVYCILFISKGIKRHNFDWLSFLFILMIFGNLGVNILGSFAEWSRLFMPSTAIVLLMIGQMCSRMSAGQQKPT